ncbi:MAG: thiamine pyrophosphate-binding protein [Firmicutes bacterium]|nr:thiamine pyrophosphate-binding protein [Bacillota bacterium]
MVKVSDLVIKFLVSQGVKHVFMLPGGGWMHILDSLGKNREIEYICNLHEQAAAIAAEAYGQYTNNLGVAIVTTGPGGTNAVTGVAAAWIDSTPCLIISGQVKRADMIGNKGLRQMGPQEADIISIVKPVTKYAVTVLDPTRIYYCLEEAVYYAKSGRPGPVWVDIPLDVQGSMVDESQLATFTPPRDPRLETELCRLKTKVEAAINLINHSKRPVILAGNGIWLAGAEKEFCELIEIINAPVLTTWKSIDLIPEDHRLFAGRPGSIGQRGANFVLQNSDLLLTIGARMDLPQTAFNHRNFGKSAQKIIVDIDEAEINKMQMEIEIPIAADAKRFICEMLSQKAKINNEGRASWLSRCMEWKQKYPVVLPEYWKQKEYVNSYVLIDVLSQEMGSEDLLVPGSSGSCSEITMQTFKVKEGQTVLNNQGFGSMGFGLPASIGACIASGKKRTVCVNGDGGFQLNIQELETVVRLQLPIKFFILNNRGYASIRNMQRNHFNGHYVGSDEKSGMSLPDIIKIAGAYGIPSERIRNQDGIAEKVRKILNSPGPFICDVMVDPDQPTAPRVSSIKLEDGSMISKSLEDMWPYLDPEELKANMINE